MGIFAYTPCNLQPRFLLKVVKQNILVLIDLIKMMSFLFELYHISLPVHLLTSSVYLIKGNETPLGWNAVQEVCKCSDDALIKLFKQLLSPPPLFHAVVVTVVSWYVLPPAC